MKIQFSDVNQEAILLVYAAEFPQTFLHEKNEKDRNVWTFQIYL